MQLCTRVKVYKSYLRNRITTLFTKERLIRRSIVSDCYSYYGYILYSILIVGSYFCKIGPNYW